MLPPKERRFEDNPTISDDIRAWNRHLAPAALETLLVPSWRRFCIVKYNISRSGYLPKCHEVLCLPRKVTLQPHQILRLPHKINVISDLRHIWNVISNACSKWSHPPTSPNTAPATKILKLKISAKLPEVLPPKERRFEDNPKISDDIRAWNRHLAPAALETLLVPSWRRFCIVKYNISRSGYLPKCHEVLRLPRKVRLELHQILRLPHKTAPATQNELWTVTLLNCDCTELWLYWTVTLLNCDCTELWLYWTVTLLNCDCTELWLYWTVTVLNCDCTELWLYWTVTLLNCYFTELLLYWTVTWLNCYITEQLLYWTVTFLKLLL